MAVFDDGAQGVDVDLAYRQMPAYGSGDRSGGLRESAALKAG